VSPSTQRTLAPNTLGELPANALLIIPLSTAYPPPQWTYADEASVEDELRNRLRPLVTQSSASTVDLVRLRDEVISRRTQLVTTVTAELLAVGKDAQRLTVGKAYDDLPPGQYRPVPQRQTDAARLAEPGPPVDETRLTPEQAALAAEIRTLGKLGTIGLPPRDAIVDLARSSHAIGDKVLVTVSHHLTASTPGRPAEPAPRLLREDQYHGIVARSGAYLHISPSLVFARADRGQRGTEHGYAMEWKPNIAVTAEWKYGDLDACGFVRWLEPGIGVHLAALDHSSEENTEMGVGVNCSVWGGLLQAGYGWNLMLDERRDYFFIGIDLLELFGASTGVKVGQ
jgi:hypothetical protein